MARSAQRELLEIKVYQDNLEALERLVHPDYLEQRDQLDSPVREASRVPLA